MARCPEFYYSDENFTDSIEDEPFLNYPNFSFLVSGILTTVFGIIGCSGNLYSIYLINYYIRLKRTIALHLTVLAAWDATLLFGAVCCYSIASIWSEILGNKIYQYVAWIFSVILQTTMTSSIWMIVMITIERHNSVWRPLEFHAKDSITRSRTICAIVSIASVLFSLPTLFELHVVNCPPSNFSNETYTALMPTTIRLFLPYNIIYRIILSTIFLSFVPFLIILVLAIRMIHFVSEASQLRVEISGCGRYGRRRSKNELVITKMLLGVVIKFLLCYTFPTLLNIWETYSDWNAIPRGEIFPFIVDLSNFLVVFNSATNCLIYFKSRKKLKQAAKNQPEKYKTRNSIDGSQMRLDSYNRSHQKTSMNQETTGLLDASEMPSSNSSEKPRPAHFTPEEAEVLKASWPLILNLDPGKKILHDLLESNADLKKFLHRNSSAENSEECNSLVIQDPEEEILRKCFTVQHELLITESLKKIVGGAGFPAAESFSAMEIQQIGLRHHNKGVQLRTADWRAFKSAVHDLAVQASTLSYAANGTSNHLTQPNSAMTQFGGPEKLVKAWNRVACYIILNIKKATP